jgi:hypothetical protein
MSKAGLTRKKITVKRGGKTFQRSVMVRAEAIGKRTGGKKLNSLNPWEAHHTALVKGPFPKSSGSSGPGSDHSWFAHAVGAHRDRTKHLFETGTESYTAQAARARRGGGESASAQYANGWGFGSEHEAISRAHYVNSTRDPELVRVHSATGIWRGHHQENVEHVPQNPNKWVRA